MASKSDSTLEVLNEAIDDPVTWEPSVAFLKIAIALIIGGATAFIIAIFVVVPEQKTRVLGVLLLQLLAGAAWYLLARGKVTAAAMTLGVGVWVYFTGVAVFLGGINAPGLLAYPIIILLVGWLVSTRASVLVACLTAAVTLGLAVVEVRGWLPVPLPSHPIMRWISMTCIYFATVALIYQVVLSYRHRLADVRVLGETLAQRSAELQASEADLHRAQTIAQVGSWVYDLHNDTM